MASTYDERKQQLNNNLEEAYNSGHTDLLPIDSLWRPSNLQLWVNMKQKEPTLPTEKPSGWDALFNDYNKRLKINNQIHDQDAQDKYKEPITLP